MTTLDDDFYDIEAEEMFGDPPEPGSDGQQPPDPFDTAVEGELFKIRVRDQATRRFRQEAEPDSEPEALRLDQLLAEPDEPVQYRLDRLWPVGGRFLLAAQAKAGKTTFRDNLVRSLADEEPFLGQYEVAPVAGTIVILDTEMSRGMIRRWLRDQGIAKTDRVVVVPLRGMTGKLDLTDPDKLAYWVERLRALDAAIVILDCLAPALVASGLDENLPTDVGRFLVAYDALLTQAGATEGGVVHHMGHAAERSRGASRLRDWPDVEWRLMRDRSDDPGEAPDPGAARYFAAYGRDVDEPERQLAYDPETRRLTIGGGSRAQARRELPTDDVLGIVTETPGLTGNSVVARMKLHGIAEKRALDARLLAVETDIVHVHNGPNRGKLHYPGGSGTARCCTPTVLHLVSGGAAPLGAPPPPPPPGGADEACTTVPAAPPEPDPPWLDEAADEMGRDDD